MKNQSELPCLSEKLIVSNSEGHYVLPIEDIIRVQANSNYSELYLVGDKKYILTKSMKSIEAKLPGDKFLRVHISHIINLDYLHLVTRSTAHLVNGDEIPISRSYKSVLMDVIKRAK